MTSTRNSDRQRKLNAEQVSEIKRLLEDGMPHHEVAKMFRVSVSTVSGIRQGHTWRWVK